jgi:signal transduction histidine kinase
VGADTLPGRYGSIYSTWERAIRTGEAYEVEFRVRYAPSGEFRWLLSRAQPVLDENKRVIKWYGSNTDIHNQKITLENLTKDQRLREQIIATLSHDLRTPLT